ncbi:MAG: glycosyltransferase family 39 protein [Armatimonadetes bacterium]|nr:glycosyltransferase family 39 protein [Armatimonadota bacterium]
MLGALITFIFAKGISALGRSFVKARWSTGDGVSDWGVGGLVGLGLVGLMVLPIGLIPGGLKIVPALAWLPALYGLFLLSKEVPAYFKRKYSIEEKCLGATLLVSVLVALVMVLTPSNTLDWDTLAYHLAVPKLWLTAGQIQYIPYIHHSNFPQTIDHLSLLGLAWGGESGAKAFQAVFFSLGLLSLFGLARANYGKAAAPWAALCLIAIPVALWESGTAYIDVGNGLYAGLGMYFAARFIAKKDPKNLVLCGILLGLAAGSKYTGLQTIGTTALVLFAAGAFAGKAASGFRSAATVGVIALALCAPWYIKNVAFTGNPVYPFFYSKIGGKNWSDFNSKIYTEEQQTFGVARKEGGGHDLKQFGHAVLGLAYQPGRYTNPDQLHGGGFPMGAVGFIPAAILLLWLISGSLTALEGAVIANVLLSFVLWFFLSQQSRYVIGFSVPLCIIAGGATTRFTISRLVQGAIAIQAMASLYVVKTFVLDARLPVLLGKQSEQDYLNATARFYKNAQFINANKYGKVALFNEVFGYFLDVPYMWANPGHSTLIPYETLQTGPEFAASLRSLGITHAYLNFGGGMEQQDFIKRWLEAMGIGAPARPFTPEERQALDADLRLKWKRLFADAVASGNFVLVPNDQIRGALLFEVK